MSPESSPQPPRDEPLPVEEESFPLMKTGWLPLYAQVLLAVVLGFIVGIYFGKEPVAIGVAPYQFSVSTQNFGVVASVIIQLLTGLAAPLIFFAIVDAFLKAEITGKQGAKMLGICAVNVAVAFAVGMTIINVFKPAAGWKEMFPELAAAAKLDATEDVAKMGQLSLTEVLQRDIPHSMVEPFVTNNIMSVVILALLVGISFRTMRGKLPPGLASEVALVEKLASGLFTLMMQMLQYVVLLIPIVVFCALAQIVGEKGLSDVLKMLGTFLGAILTGMAIHSLLYYPLVSWLIGGINPLAFFRASIPAVLTGLSINSSLATVPVTLESLRKLGVSESSARLSACVGTNFNNDGISLYEAMTALFLAQAIGYQLTVSQQIIVMLAALSACLGSAGVPSSGMVILPLVLKAAGLPAAVIVQGIGLVQSVDWIAARCRSGVNVLGDITVGILLDAGKPKK